MPEQKECAQCSRVFPRKDAFSEAQWAETSYCSRGCAGKARQGRPFLSAIFSKIDIDPATKCWLWNGSKDSKGYGLVTRGADINKKVHRVVFELSVGPIPTEAMVLHRCDTPSCCNPYHLFTGSAQDNVDDMRLKRRERFLRGDASPSSRLTEAQVILIRADTRQQDEIAAEYGIAQTTVSAIKTGRNWSHV